MNLSIKIDLLKLKGASLVNLKGKEATKACIVILVEDRNLYHGEKGVYMDISAFAMKESKYDQTHILKESIAKEAYQAMSDDERKALPIIGSIKELKAQTVQPTETLEPEQHDDLPF